MVAQFIATTYPTIVSKLVLIDTSYGTRSTPMDAFLTDITLPMFNMMPVQWQAKLFANQIGKHSANAKAYIQKEIGKHANDKQNYLEIWKAVTQFDGYQSLDKIICPTLILVGDLNTQTHGQAKVMHERIAKSKLVHIEQAGHMLNWDHPEQFNKVLLEFIKS